MLKIYLKFLNLNIFCWCILFVEALPLEFYSSPCPQIFQYETNKNGELYGLIKIPSIYNNVIQKLTIDLIVRNNVQNEYSGIQFISLNELHNEMLHIKPIKYKVIFPKWKNVPPKLGNIFLNNILICSGLPIPDWPTSTSIILEHVLIAKKASYISKSRKRRYLYTGSNPFLNENNNRFSSYRSNPFLNNNQNFSNFLNVGGVKTNGNNFSKNNQTFSTFLNIGGAPTERNNFLYNKQNFNNFLSNRHFLNNNGNNFLNFLKTSGVTTESPKFSNKCGTSEVPSTLVINGNLVQHGAFPWLAAMFIQGRSKLLYQCTGTLISKKHIVTAAHCIRKNKDHYFVLGKLNIMTLSNDKTIKAGDIHIHPNYDVETLQSDIAVAILIQEVQFNKFIQPICLWSESGDISIIVGEKGKVVGWGKDENGMTTAEPRQISMPIVDHQQCRESHSSFLEYVTPQTFCAGTRNNSGPCMGDSGSGFIMERNKRWVLRGVVSLSLTPLDNRSDCDLSNYVLFTDTTKFMSWLLAYM